MKPRIIDLMLREAVPVSWNVKRWFKVRFFFFLFYKCFPGLWNGMQFLGHSQTSGIVSHLIETVILSKRPLCTQIYMLSVPTLILWFALGLSVSLCSVFEALNRDGQYGVSIIFLMNLRINKITFVQIKLFFGKLYQITKSMHVHV